MYTLKYSVSGSRLQVVIHIDIHCMAASTSASAHVLRKARTFLHTGILIQKKSTNLNLESWHFNQVSCFFSPFVLTSALLWATAKCFKFWLAFHCFLTSCFVYVCTSLVLCAFVDMRADSLKMGSFPSHSCFHCRIWHLDLYFLDQRCRSCHFCSHRVCRFCTSAFFLKYSCWSYDILLVGLAEIQIVLALVAGKWKFRVLRQGKITNDTFTPRKWNVHLLELLGNI